MYIIVSGGRFLADKKGWGPTFTSFIEDARKFKSPRQADDYIQEYGLDDLGAFVAHC